MKVSVCIPVYGVEKYIERCARSLFEQTMKEDIEFIFVNDCTKDKSIEILEQVLSEYPERKEQVKIIHHQKNSGLVAARKTGLAHAKGEYIAHCDSDDWVENEMYETMYEKAKQNDADFVYCAHCLDDGFRHVKNRPVKRYQQMEYVLKDPDLFVGLWTKIFKREIALCSDFFVPDDICFGEDLLRVTQSLLKCKTVVGCTEAFYHYFHGNEGAYTSTFKRSSLEQWIKAVSFLKEHYTDKLDLTMWQGEILFHTTIRYMLTNAEYNALWRQERMKILLAPKLHPIKKIVVFMSFISYPLTAMMGKIIFKWRKR